jgi:glycosyltransferase involved in cell wall biosynthesis
MRVLQLHNRQLATGGADLQLANEARALRRRGVDVETMLVDNHDIEQLGPLRAGVRSVWNHEANRELRNLVRQFHPDIVHVHTPFPLMSPSVFWMAARLDLPTVATVQSFRYSCVRGTLEHDSKVCELCVGRRIKLPAARYRCYHHSVLGSAVMAGSLSLHHGVGTFSRCVDRFLALTEFMRERLLMEGLRPEQVTVKPNSIRDPGPPLAQRGGYALFTGRLAPEKGMATVLRAWSQLDSELRLVIAGDGAQRAEVELAARRDDRIDYRGWLDHDDVMKLVREATVLLVPSEWYEAFGIVVIEAMAAATPVVISDRANNTGLVIPGVTGEVFPAGDAAALASAVLRLIGRHDLDAMGRAGRERFLEGFEEELVLDQLLGVYDEVRAARARGARPGRPSPR